MDFKRNGYIYAQRERERAPTSGSEFSLELDSYVQKQKNETKANSSSKHTHTYKMIFNFCSAYCELYFRTRFKSTHTIETTKQPNHINFKKNLISSYDLR